MESLIRTGVFSILFVGSVQAGALRQDLESLFTFENTGAATLGLAGVAYNWDDDIRGELEGAFLVDRPSDLTDIYGSSSFNLPVSLGMWGLGRSARREELEEIGAGLVRTLAFTQLVVGPIKSAVRRERPDGSNRLSFPSGHTANSFAVARLLHRHYGPRAGIPLYVLGGFVAAGRLEGNRHFLSDVVMGAVLGTIVGNSVTLKPDGRFTVLPAMKADGLMLALHIRP